MSSDQQIDPLGAVLAALDEVGVAWLALRDDPLDAAAPDVDLLVRPDEIERLALVAKRAGFGRVAAWGHGSHHFYFAYQPATDGWLKLDVVSGLGFRDGTGLPGHVTDALIERRVRAAGGGWRPAPADELWALLLHCLLDRRSFPARHATRLQALVGGDIQQGPIHATLALDEPLPGLLADRIRVADWPAALELRERVRKTLGASVASTARVQLRRLLRAAQRQVGGNRMSVALIGADDDARTALARSLGAGFGPPAGAVRFHVTDGGGRGEMLATARPRPNLIIVLDGQPDERLAGGVAVEVVDASRGTSDLRRAVTLIAWRRYVERQ